MSDFSTTHSYLSASPLSIYMKINGIAGNVTAKNYQQWIEVFACAYRVERHVSATPGKMSDRESARPSFTEFSLSKQIDNASPKLFIESCKGKALDKVTLHFIHASNNQMAPFLEFELSDVIISHYGLSHNEQTFQEMLRLSYSKIEQRYTPSDATGKPTAPIAAMYDLTTATAA